MKQELKFSFYGDDFTGSTDVMESLSFNGIPAALFLEAPEPEEVGDFRLKNTHIAGDHKLKAFGVAGVARSLTPDQMNEELPGILEKISKIPTQYFHYKVCSTFDSSPQVGNIGHAVDIALQYFPSSHIPLVVGIPLLNRFCVFGNLFARVDDTTYRIDRHPTMSKHPITPMHEADLRIHLGKQTDLPVRSVDVLQLRDEETSSAHYKNLTAQEGFILFDVLRHQHLEQIGKLIDDGQRAPQQLLVGSSGVEYALCNHWQHSGTIEKPSAPTHTKKADRYMVIAGSCSPCTADQIQYGIDVGYSAIRVDSVKLVENRALEIINCTNACLKALENNRVPILYSALGPDDPCIEATKITLKNSSTKESIGSFLASAQGEILKNIIDKTGKLRVTVAGGDTSGFVTKTLGIYALEVLVPIAPGSPLCIAHAKDIRYDGLEISLKGGQNGNSRFFEYVNNGKAE